MKTVKDFLELSNDDESINEQIRNRTLNSIKSFTNTTYQKIQREDDTAALVKLNAELLQLIISLLLKGK